MRCMSVCGEVGCVYVDVLELELREELRDQPEDRDPTSSVWQGSSPLAGCNVSDGQR